MRIVFHHPHTSSYTPHWRTLFICSALVYHVVLLNRPSRLFRWRFFVSLTWYSSKSILCIFSCSSILSEEIFFSISCFFDNISLYLFIYSLSAYASKNVICLSSVKSLINMLNVNITEVYPIFPRSMFTNVYNHIPFILATSFFPFCKSMSKL